MPHEIATPSDAHGPKDGFWPIEDYAALGDGRSVALIAPDGSMDWWCVPDMDSPPLFDRLLDRTGGFFQIRPNEAFTVTRHYRPDSNVLESHFKTKHGEARLTESLNSSLAGRLPWAEFARRLEGLSGRITFHIHLTPGTQCGTVSPWLQHNTQGNIFHVGHILGLLRHTDNVHVLRAEDPGIEAEITLTEGKRATIAILAGADEPLGIPTIEDIDARIDTSDTAWRDWAADLKYDGPYRNEVRRSALALKLLLYSPSGAIAAAATTSLPEKIGGNKNWDYRYAWIRDAAYTVNAFLRIGAMPEAKAAFTWLIHRLNHHGPKVLYSLSGHNVPNQIEHDEVQGYRNSLPVVSGNLAALQHQHGIYGDIFETAYLFVTGGNILDQTSARLLASLADRCADHWRQKDAGIWELQEPQHYTMSKISCWQALTRASQLAEDEHIPADCLPRWQRERIRIAEWIDTHCWSETRQAYTFHAGTERLDASLALAIRFGFDGRDRMSATLDALKNELSRGPFYYRYSGADSEEGTFLACSFWMVEGLFLLGRKQEAHTLFEDILTALPKNTGTLAEMIDPHDNSHLGNTPQGLSHLTLVHAACTLAEDRVTDLSRKGSSRKTSH